MVDWVDIGAWESGGIRKLGISERLHSDETLVVLHEGFSITHSNRCNLLVKTFWISAERFNKALKKWRQYGSLSEGMHCGG